MSWKKQSIEHPNEEKPDTPENMEDYEERENIWILWFVYHKSRINVQQSKTPSLLYIDKNVNGTKRKSRNRLKNRWKLILHNCDMKCGWVGKIVIK